MSRRREMSEPILVRGSTYIEPVAESPTLFYSAKASHAQLPDIPLQTDT